jgi:hypothetical protein
MIPENKQKNRRYKQINFIGLQNNRHPSQHTVDHGGNPRTCDSGSAIDSYRGLCVQIPEA